jgi:hypothetical protein
MNPFKKFVFLVLLTLATTIPGRSSGLPFTGNPTTYTLYPPVNLTGSMVECNGYLTWQKPELPNGATPAGILGYYIYRDGIMITYKTGSGNTTHYDYDLPPGTYAYTITAYYDLASYGSPGQFEESAPAGPISLSSNCDFPFPFNEPWDAGTFSLNGWQFSPSQLNWAISTSGGNPIPAVVFNGTPGVQAYSSRMESHWIYGNPWVCANMFLEFDYKLTDISAGGTEKLTAEYKIDNIWSPVMEFTNQGSTGWIHQKLDISAVCGKTFNIGFGVSGTNSANVSSWAIDNIKVYSVCTGPGNCSASRSGNVVHLTWEPPPCDSLQYLAGYHICRADCGPVLCGLITNTPVQGLEYFDTITAPPACGQLWYQVSTLYVEPLTGVTLCMGCCEWLQVDVATGINPADSRLTQIVANPASGEIRVQSDSPVEYCEVLNMMGQTVISVPTRHSMELTVPTSRLPSGIYLVSIKNASGNFVKKVSLMH